MMCRSLGLDKNCLQNSWSIDIQYVNYKSSVIFSHMFRALAVRHINYDSGHVVGHIFGGLMLNMLHTSPNLFSSAFSEQ